MRLAVGRNQIAAARRVQLQDCVHLATNDDHARATRGQAVGGHGVANETIAHTCIHGERNPGTQVDDIPCAAFRRRDVHLPGFGS